MGNSNVHVAGVRRKIGFTLAVKPLGSSPHREGEFPHREGEFLNASRGSSQFPHREGEFPHREGEFPHREGKFPHSSKGFTEGEIGGLVVSGRCRGVRGGGVVLRAGDIYAARRSPHPCSAQAGNSRKHDFGRGGVPELFPHAWTLLVWGGWWGVASIHILFQCTPSTPLSLAAAAGERKVRC
jgi:hypothetical protein